MTRARDLSNRASDFVSVKDFGAKGDGTTDDTAAINLAITWLNTSNGLTLTIPTGTYVCGMLNSITSNNGTIIGQSATILSKPNTLTVGNGMFTLTGNNILISGIIFDGNQANYTSGVSGQLLSANGNGYKINNCKFINSPGRGFVSVASNCVITDCNFDDNANLGMQHALGSYLDFTNCSWDRNGYGFQKTLATNTFSAFGFAVRYKASHLTFTACRANYNGRDGMNINQGSYAVKFIGCQCAYNYDGGFTVAADNNGTGNPGEGQSPWKIEYVDCEAYGNYTSGLAVYQPIYSLQVIGGRYFNNHTNAGDLTEAVSYLNGIFIAGGSRNVIIRGADCYDERQYCVITAVDNVPLGYTPPQFTVAATGWITGSTYEKIAIYSSTGAFKGYGILTNDASAAAVSFKTTTYNGVTMTAGSVVAGDYITQAVQHNGIFCDNGTIASVDAIGFGHRIGPTSTISGELIYSGGYNNNQNVLLSSAIPTQREWLLNPSFDVNTLNWAYNIPGGGSYTRTTATYIKSTASLQLVSGASNTAEADATLDTGYLAAFDSTFVRFSGWAYSTKYNAAQLVFIWIIGGNTFSTSALHPGGGWKYLSICARVPTGATAAIVRIQTLSGSNTAYFDELSVRSVQIANDQSNLWTESAAQTQN